eukprot:7716387-Karenia_brevis.AAC.1
MGRTVWSLLGHWELCLFLFADDSDLLAAGTDAVPKLALTMMALHLIGTPISWRKVAGGSHYEWMGHGQIPKSFEIGLSIERTTWLHRWAVETLEMKVVLVRRVMGALGRMGYARNPVSGLRPFLGPLYAWTASLPGGAL